MGSGLARVAEWTSHPRLRHLGRIFSANHDHKSVRELSLAFALAGRVVFGAICNFYHRESRIPRQKKCETKKYRMTRPSDFVILINVFSIYFCTVFGF